MEKSQIKEGILGIISVAGLLAFAAVAPNAIQTLEHFGIVKRKYSQKYYINRTVKRLVDQGLVILQRNTQGILCAKLTPKGKEKIEEYRLKDFTIIKPKKWDKKYRVIIFDIKEWKRNIRDRLRRWLEHVGFIKLQNSVWVYPYECQEIIALLKSYFKIGNEILYLTVESIENDKWLKESFELK
ncbi:MAG: CRISPR-associated endonuclease Cas2 [Patescibacteria group bacterium]